MASKTNAEVIIDGKVYTLAGFESEEYLQKVASYLNGKIGELSSMDNWIKLSTDYRNILLQINMADDYFQAQREASELKAEVEQKEKDVYDLKHELIATQMKLEQTEKNLRNAKEENDENTKKLIRH